MNGSAVASRVFSGSRGWKTQPRDDLGRWTDGAGRLSAGHVSHVMHSEGIHDRQQHDAVQRDIASGKVKTRADVLKLIDAIHAANKAPGFNEARAAHHAANPVDKQRDHNWRSGQIAQLQEQAKQDLAGASTAREKRDAQARLEDANARAEAGVRYGEINGLNHGTTDNAAGSAKEPWQMSPVEYAATNPLPRRKSGEFHTMSRAGELQHKHESEVAVALQLGKPVPKEVLSQYPRLQHKLPDQWNRIMSNKPDSAKLNSLIRKAAR